VVTFDPLGYARRLRGAGLTDEQAEVHAEALATALGEVIVTKQDLRDLATKDDVHRLDLATKQEFASVRQEMGSEFASVRREMRAMELRLTMRLGALFSIAVGALAAILKMA
jgi:hypothetical protein